MSWLHRVRKILERDQWECAKRRGFVKREEPCAMTCEQAVRQFFMHLDRALASDACPACSGQLAFSC